MVLQPYTVRAMRSWMLHSNSNCKNTADSESLNAKVREIIKLKVRFIQEVLVFIFPVHAAMVFFFFAIYSVVIQ